MVVVVLLTANQMATDLLNQLWVAMVVLLVVEASEVVEAIVETSNARVPVGTMIVMQNGLGTRTFMVANVLAWGRRYTLPDLLSRSLHQANAGLMANSLGLSIPQVFFKPTPVFVSKLCLFLINHCFLGRQGVSLYCLFRSQPFIL